MCTHRMMALCTYTRRVRALGRLRARRTPLRARLAVEHVLALEAPGLLRRERPGGRSGLVTMKRQAFDATWTYTARYTVYVSAHAESQNPRQCRSKPASSGVSGLALATQCGLGNSRQSAPAGSYGTMHEGKKLQTYTQSARGDRYVGILGNACGLPIRVPSMR